jgi:hypothetical protein
MNKITESLRNPANSEYKGAQTINESMLIAPEVWNQIKMQAE